MNILKAIFGGSWTDLVEENTNRPSGHHHDGYSCPCCRRFFPKSMWEAASGTKSQISAAPKPAVVQSSGFSEVCIPCWNTMHNGETI